MSSHITCLRLLTIKDGLDNVDAPSKLIDTFNFVAEQYAMADKILNAFSDYTQNKIDQETLLKALRMSQQGLNFKWVKVINGGKNQCKEKADMKN